MFRKFILSGRKSVTLIQDYMPVWPRCVQIQDLASQSSQYRDNDPISKCTEIQANIDNVETSAELVELNPFAPIGSVQKNFLNELRPPIKRSFNLASYVNESRTLQRLIQLGVSLFDIENLDRKAAKSLATLDFEKDCAPYLKLLVENGLKDKNIGRFISECPKIFLVPIDDLQARLNYLEHKGFTPKMIAKALNTSSHILSHQTIYMDEKLGKLQIEFRLPATNLRTMVVKHPEVIAIPDGQYKLINFTLNEEFGFRTNEIHKILVAQPKVIDILRPVLQERLDLLHNEIGLSHETITLYPKLIIGPKLDIRHRALYLKKLKRDQYNPKKPLYVPASALYNLSDSDFCAKYAKTDLEDFKLFVKLSC